MSGQSANLTLKEACAMQERIQHPGSHALSHGGKSSKSSGEKKGGAHTPIDKKVSHQG